jgi:uncharacterized membrane protein YgcG
VRVNVWVCVHVGVFVWFCLFIFACVRVCVCVCVCVCVYVCVRMQVLRGSEREKKRGIYNISVAVLFHYELDRGEATTGQCSLGGGGGGGGGGGKSCGGM